MICPFFLTTSDFTIPFSKIWCTLMHTAESDSAVWCTPWSLTQWCDAHLGVRLGSRMHIAHRGAFLKYFITWLHGGMYTAELDLAVGCTPQSFSKNFDHLTPQWDAHCRVKLLGMMHTVESDSAVGCTPQCFLKIWISRGNRNRIQKYFSLFIRGLL